MALEVLLHRVGDFTELYRTLQNFTEISVKLGDFSPLFSNRSGDTLRTILSSGI